jgi:pyridoxamine 5'-phosphate oxidase
MNKNNEQLELLQIKDPWEGFQKWLQEAQNTSLKEFNAVSLSTTNLQGRVSCRTVLLKKFSPEDGFVFYTNLNSQKGKDLQERAWAAMLFYWDALQKQIRIEGKCEVLSAESTKTYFHTRPRQSQIAAWASDQSAVIQNRKELLDRYHYFEEKFKATEQIPLPDYWRGIALKPSQIEFWKGGDFRLHQRLRFIFEDNYTWHSEMLSP